MCVRGTYPVDASVRARVRVILLDQSAYLVDLSSVHSIYACSGLTLEYID